MWKVGKFRENVREGFDVLVLVYLCMRIIRFVLLLMSSFNNSAVAAAPAVDSHDLLLACTVVHCFTIMII